MVLLYSGYEPHVQPVQQILQYSAPEFHPQPKKKMMAGWPILSLKLSGFFTKSLKAAVSVCLQVYSLKPAMFCAQRLRLITVNKSTIFFSIRKFQRKYHQSSFAVIILYFNVWIHCPPGSLFLAFSALRRFSLFLFCAVTA